MIILIFSVILIFLAGIERFIYVKKDKSWDKVRLIIGILMAIFLFLISYYITDTAISLFYVFSSFIIFISISIIVYRSNNTTIKYLSYIIGFPFMTYSLIKATQNMLISLEYIFLILFTINCVLSYPYKQKQTTKENISIAIGAVMTILVIFSYYKLSGYGNRIMLKQELVAEKYLEEELGIDGLDIYSDSLDMSLRGEEIKIRAYNSSETYITMIYRNNEIVSYKIEN